MQSPYNFIISPLGGRYITSKNIGDKVLYTTASIENAKDVNRLAVVVNVPINYNGDIKKGDLLIIHHNVFRDYYNTKGKINNSQSYLFDDLFLLNQDLIYLYNKGDGWIPNSDFCFISPLRELNKLTNKEQLVELQGVVKYSNIFNKGEHIGFTSDSEYEFEIDGEILYRMTTNDICIIY